MNRISYSIVLVGLPLGVAGVPCRQSSSHGKNEAVLNKTKYTL